MKKKSYRKPLPISHERQQLLRTLRLTTPPQIYIPTSPCLSSPLAHPSSNSPFVEERDSLIQRTARPRCVTVCLFCSLGVWPRCRTDVAESRCALGYSLQRRYEGKLCGQVGIVFGSWVRHSVHCGGIPDVSTPYFRSDVNGELTWLCDDSSAGSQRVAHKR